MRSTGSGLLGVEGARVAVLREYRSDFYRVREEEQDGGGGKNKNKKEELRKEEHVYMVE